MIIVVIFLLLGLKHHDLQKVTYRRMVLFGLWFHRGKSPSLCGKRHGVAGIRS